jgi:tetratricopeptide (TPR) repeat protein
MDDAFLGTAWQLDAATQLVLRLEQIRKNSAAGDFEAAALEAEELLDEHPDEPTALFLLGEASLELGEPEIAALAYETHLRVTAAPNGAALVGLAIARLDLCRIVGAVEAAQEAVRLAPDLAEAHYYLALGLEWLGGRSTDALQSFAAARELDRDRWPFPLQLDLPGWQAAVKAALQQLPPETAQFWLSVPIHLERRPDLEEIRKSDPPISPRVPALYDGKPEEDAEPGQSRPTRLRLFTNNLERSPSLEELVARVADALESEAASWLGLDSGEIDAT